MSGAKTGSAFLIAILAAIVLFCAGIAQMHAQTQQPGTQPSASATLSSAATTANASAANPAGTSSNTANPAGVSNGASSWTSGQGSFGVTGKTPVGSSTGVKGNWVAGSGSFGMQAQPGGIWHESGSGSVGTPSPAPTRSPAAEGFAPAALPGLAAEGPATAGSPGPARSGGIPASRSLLGAHPAFGASSGSRTGGSRSVGTKPASLGAHRQQASQGRAGTNQASGAGSSNLHAKTQARSGFTPSRPFAPRGTRKQDSTHETIP